jgi:5-methylcytosine-specific restriction enzyme A
MARFPYNTPEWQRLRLAKLAQCPFCYPCSLRGIRQLAHVVDHIHAIVNGGNPFPALNGLMSMCTRCHNSKTSAVDRPDRRSSDRRFKGCDEQGNPIDPDDFWNGGPVKDGDHKGGQTAGGTQRDLLSKKPQGKRS